MLASTALVVSLTMAVLSFVEGAFCPFCVLWYGINFLLAWLAWRCRDRELRVRDTLDDSIGTAAVIAALLFGATIYGTTALMRYQRVVVEAERDAIAIPAVASELLEQTPVRFEVPDAPSKGPDDAEVTFVEFGDFECPFCRKLFFGLEHYAETSSRSVRIVFAHYPLDSACNPHVERRHPQACVAAYASECARQQGKFWEYAEKLFDNQSALQRDDLVAYAAELGLDGAAFGTCIDAPATREKIRADVELGTQLDITGTPTFFTNGYKRTGALPPSILAGVVEVLLGQPSAQGSLQ